MSNFFVWVSTAKSWIFIWEVIKQEQLEDGELLVETECLVFTDSLKLNCGVGTYCASNGNIDSQESIKTRQPGSTPKLR